MKSFWNNILIPLVAAALAGCSQRPADYFQGYIEGEFVYLAAPLGGALTHLDVARGDEVKPGQVLFELERQSEAAALDQANQNLAQAKAQLADLTKGKRPSEIDALQAQLEHAKASLQLADAEFKRREKLVDSKVISQEELDQSRTQKTLAEAQVTQLTADLETAKLGARQDAIHAAQAAVEAQQAAWAKAQWAFGQKRQISPTNGVVQDTLYRAGEWVAAGNPVVVVLPPTNIKVRFFVPQAILPQIKPGQTVSVQCDGASAPIQATINYISTKAEYTPPVIYSRETRAELVFMIEATFAPADAAKLRPGQPADVYLK